jgi:hypothetical protein
MNLPKVTGTLSDSAKLAFDDLDQTVAKLIYLAVITDNFANLSAWTETDADAKVNLSGGVVTMNGGAAWNTHGLLYTGGITQAEGYFELKFNMDSLVQYGFTIAVNNVNAIPNGSTANSFFISDSSTGNMRFWAGGTDLLSNLIFSEATWYTVRIYINKSADGTSWKRLRIAVVGGSYTQEKILYETDMINFALTSPFYFSFSRYANSPTKKVNYKEFRWYSGYATDGPYTTYTHDAGANKGFFNFDMTNLAMPASMSSTNLKFAYYFGNDSGGALSSWQTLAQFNGNGKITGWYRYIKIAVQNNSDGSTLVYGAKPNSSTATDGCGSMHPVKVE